MTSQTTDILLIGGGVMSTTLASLVSQLDSTRHIMLVEQSQSLAGESSDAWNNAGTGHAGYCELNYTPKQRDGRIAIERALDINARFEISLQYWSSLVRQGVLPDPATFINRVPHLSWVRGQDAVDYLKARHETLSAHPLFDAMRFSDDPGRLAEWLPLMMGQNRSDGEPVAATRVGHGSDVDFGALTRTLGQHLETHSGVDVRLGTRVIDLHKRGKRWQVTLRCEATSQTTVVDAGFVFVGAGGAALPLLQKAGVAEAKGYGGFPVSGIWLACENEAIAREHGAKVYGKAPVGAPPMSVPHLDTRVIDGRPALLFGPFAGFTTRFLKQGSRLDLMQSVRSHNLKPMMEVAGTQWPLTRYLIKEALSSREDRLAQLERFLPEYDPDQWQLRYAGQRVQIIKPDANGRGKLEFGTEVLNTRDRSLAALLGASPGASTSVSAMLDVIERCLPELTQGEARERLQSLIPSYGQSLIGDAGLLREVRQFTLGTLGLADLQSIHKRSLNHADWHPPRNDARGESRGDHSLRHTGTA
ncbi:malate dehydrogenase (quinone) [Tamilnaduibacter salinus]|uniref:Probable malate:quinone oxidoreductase n=1 Tax=Tamilnaduibacter salinus TaxID=1484056 RepID=A0A2U1CWT7_9GAMM|nr:malate dehydrogenase (quinone) [Tamilnaduibacter salinus]PVY76416.1 malate dehydrogenase (quinone) [Tamilnaduibacter salinus]